MTGLFSTVTYNSCNFATSCQIICSSGRPKSRVTAAHAHSPVDGAGKSLSFPPLSPRTPRSSPPKRARARSAAGRGRGGRRRSQPAPLPSRRAPRARQVSPAPIGCRGRRWRRRRLWAPRRPSPPFVANPSFPFLTKESSFQFRVVIRVIRLEEKRRVARARREGEGEDSQRAQR